MTTEREINWAAPVVGKLVDGKTYVDRRGKRHTLTMHLGNGEHSWWASGMFGESSDQRHVLDLIAEYTPPAPLKMWMNAFDSGVAACLYDSEERAKASTTSYDRIAVPVTITEGHGDD